MFAPRCTRLRAEAPGVQLTVLPIAGVPRDRGVEPGEVHVRAERSGQTLARPTNRVLFEDDFVVLMARKHRRAAKTLTLRGYLSLPHVKVTADAVGTNMSDDVLRRHGLRRDIHLTVPSWFEMQRVIVSTDLVAVAPRHWGAGPALREGCVCHDLPLVGVALSVELEWHPQDAANAGNKWLRDAITDSLAPWAKRGRRGRSTHCS
jgi:DNA-binding transcriptional LysR family regulator